MHHPAVGRTLVVDDAAARRRGRRGRGSPASCRAAWRGRCAGGSTPPARRRPSSPVRKWSSPVSPTARTRGCAGQPLDLGERRLELPGGRQPRRLVGVQRDPGDQRVVRCGRLDRPARRRAGRSRSARSGSRPTAAAAAIAASVVRAAVRRRRCRGGSGCRRPGAAAARGPAGSHGSVRRRRAASGSAWSVHGSIARCRGGRRRTPAAWVRRRAARPRRSPPCGSSPAASSVGHGGPQRRPGRRPRASGAAPPTPRW